MATSSGTLDVFCGMVLVALDRGNLCVWVTVEERVSIRKEVTQANSKAMGLAVLWNSELAVKISYFCAKLSWQGTRFAFALPQNSCSSSCNIAYSLDSHQFTGGSVIVELFTACRWRLQETMAGLYT